MKRGTARLGLAFAVVSVMLTLVFLLAPWPVGMVQAANDQVRINEIVAGVNGNSKIQYIELQVADSTHKLWGPQTGEIVGRAMLVFFDAAGNQTGRYVFPKNPGGSGNTILVATDTFAAQRGAPVPDFIIRPELVALSGKVCFRNNPLNPNATPINLCLSYGSFTGDTEGAGPPAPTLPILDANSLRRVQNLSAFGAASNNNADFQLGTPDPTNTAGRTISFAVQARRVQGQTLFFNETWNGNGRTCASCHRSEDNFGLQPDTIPTIPSTDPLFIAEFNLNTLVLTGDAQPSDLRGLITDSSGIMATVLRGVAARTYLVYGGQGMSGTVVDETGNTGTVASFTIGDLNQLEDPALMRGGRALIKLNPDGFDQPAVFRKTPHLLNLSVSEPFGFGGDFATLDAQAIGAVRQHHTRSLNRVEGVDFRLPTVDEQSALRLFQNSIRLPPDGNFTIDRFVTTEAQERGRALFFSTVADGFNCDICHDGIALGGVNNFNTVVQELPIDAALPREPATGPLRLFNVTTLFDVKHNGPYFHANEVATLRDAIMFYAGPEFQNSGNGFLIDETFFQNQQNVDDLLAFLEALVVTPFTVTPATVDLGTQEIDNGPTASMDINVTNNGTAPLTIQSVVLNGGTPDQFLITSTPPATEFGQNQSRTIQVAFDPSAVGLLTTNLEMAITSASESWSWGVALNGVGEDLASPVGTLQGNVRDAVSGAAISGATVTIDIFSAVTDANGFYQISKIPVGTYTVNATATGFASASSTGVVISDGGTATVDFNLNPACTSACLRSTRITLQTRSSTGVNGQVVVQDEAAGAVSSATVSATWTKPDGTTQTATAVTSSTGRASFQIASAGAGTYTLTVTNITKTGMTFDPANSVLSQSGFFNPGGT